jgi:O-antigen/teichoic acid export membrane protein
VIRPGERTRDRSVASDSIEALALKVALAVVSFGGSILISRGLGPEGRGRYSLPVVAAATMASFCRLGIEHGNVFLFGTRGLPLARLSGQSGLVALAMGGIGFLLLVGMPYGHLAFLADTPPLLLLLAGLTIPFALHTQFTAGLLTLCGQVTWQFVASLLASGGQVALLLGLFFLRRFSVSGVLGVNLAASVLSWALTAWRLAELGPRWIRWDWPLLKETLRQSLMLHLGMALFFLHLRVDMFMVKGIAGTEALGQYSLSVLLAETVLLATDSLALALLPRQMSNAPHEAATLALRGARASAILGVALAAFWLLGGGLAIRFFFGVVFAPAYPPLIGLLPGMIFLGMQRVCGGPAIRAGTPTRIAGIYALSLLCNILLNLWWIPTYGPLGAAVASSLSYGIGALMFLGWTARMASAPLLAAIIPRWADVQSLRHLGAAQLLRTIRSARAGSPEP